MNVINGNYFDLVIIVVFSYFVIQSFKHGFWVSAVNFISFLSSLVLSLSFYNGLSNFININFSINGSTSDAIAFLISAIVLESAIGYILGFLISKLPKKILDHKFINVFGIIPGVGESFVVVSFLITLIIASPIKPQIKLDLSKSRIGSFILSNTTFLETEINKVFGKAISESLTYFTVSPETDKVIQIEVLEYNLKVDESAESEMLDRLNDERQKMNIEKLTFDKNLLVVARNHAQDMWQRKYFAHVSPDGKDVGDRLKDEKISYNVAGENLALAPTTLTAHKGLMNSKGHRENILDKRFKKVAIGVIDNGVYGKMYVQVFTN